MRTRKAPDIKRRRVALLVLSVVSAASLSARADHPPPPHGLREGGVLEGSYHYHRQGGHAPLSTVPRYSYGFPVPSYKWGWFGAKHYYPRTTSHRGYNNDYWQWAYRRGY